ncbi:MAG TPA: MopE-related protein, partial [Polyangiales bacterium]|nr:MopE-related protein [Polyangiales bacterium]
AERTSTSPRVDCDDRDPERNSRADERPNFADDDCDGVVDEGVEVECPLAFTQYEGRCEAAVDLVAGNAFACLLTDAGRVLCWGRNQYGALGTPELANSSVPFVVPGVTGAKALIAAYSAVCAVRDEDALCWGGMVAYPFHVPLPVGTKQLVISSESVANGTERLLYALDDQLVTWKRPFLAESTEAFERVADDLAQLVGGGGTACAITQMGDLVCDLAGMRKAIASNVDYSTKSASGALCYHANGELHCSADANSAGQLKLPDNEGAAGAALGPQYGCGLGESGRLTCWTPGAPFSVHDAIDVAIGDGFGCVRRKFGKVSCWGKVQGGELGNGVAESDKAESVDIVPAVTLDVPELTLLGRTALGACDTAQDLAVRISSTDLQLDFAECLVKCETSPEPANCRAECSVDSRLSTACGTCYDALVACQGGPSCYDDFASCAGYPLDFARGYQPQPRTRCEGAICQRGRNLGEACEQDWDCFSGRCGELLLTPLFPICVPPL